MAASPPSLFVFGYGSLIWNPGFAFSEKQRGYAVGYARRMYQGNTFHRGDDRLPGRVATLVDRRDALTSGVLFRINGATAIEKALKHLQEREVENGYEFRLVRVVLSLEEGGDSFGSGVLALTCIATASNALFLGPARPAEMALQIGTAKGKAGPNHEYVLKLAAHIRGLFPGEEDSHLFGLERRVRQVLRATA